MKKYIKILLMLIFLTISLIALNSELEIPYSSGDGFVKEWLATIK